MKVTQYKDPVVERYLRDVDRTLLRENLKLTPAQRLEKFVNALKFAVTLKGIGSKTALSSRKSTTQ
jgi:hypothetical protein